mmetsp:Transcript_3094/g.4731  ORF Transcript_3094/g.4731 Transcript_3094/m.4731 type:complete len:234 (+) Transcript_3094:54-755(+)
MVVTPMLPAFSNAFSIATGFRAQPIDYDCAIKSLQLTIPRHVETKICGRLNGLRFASSSSFRCVRRQMLRKKSSSHQKFPISCDSKRSQLSIIKADKLKFSISTAYSNVVPLKRSSDGSLIPTSNRNARIFSAIMGSTVGIVLAFTAASFRKGLFFTLGSLLPAILVITAFVHELTPQLRDPVFLVTVTLGCVGMAGLEVLKGPWSLSMFVSSVVAAAVYFFYQRRQVSSSEH